MAQMLNSTVVPAMALVASLEELASLVDRATDLEYLARSTEPDGTSVGVQVASCVRHVSAVIAGRPVPIPAIEHSRQRGLSALRATVRGLDAMTTDAMGEPLVLDSANDPQGARLQRTAATGRALGLLLQQVRHHKAQAIRCLSSPEPFRVSSLS
jgi:predicted thioesterase